MKRTLKAIHAPARGCYPGRPLFNKDSSACPPFALLCPAAPTASIAAPEAKRLTTRYNSPGANECVRLAKNPMTIGPTKPPRFPTELIKPMEAAAADSLRNRVGTAQKQGWKP